MQQIIRLVMVCCLLPALNAAAQLPTLPRKFGPVGGKSTEAPHGESGNWGQFLGPARTGISNERGLIDAWPAGGIREVWRANGGGGMSGLAIRHGWLITLVQKEGEQWLIALDAKTGAGKWQTRLAGAYKNNQGDGPRATPTIEGELVFAFTGDGTLAAVNPRDGKIQWSHNVVNDAGGKIADYGMASSPLVIGDLVIVTVGAPQACVVAYRAISGIRAWQSGSGPAGYSSPALLNIAGKLQVVVFAGSSVLGLAPENGALLWHHLYETDYDCNIATPLAIGDSVFISSGENHGSVLLKLTPKDTTGIGEKFLVEEVWSSQGPQSVLRCEWQTPILLDGKLYGLDNSGSAGPVTNLTCIDAATGKRLWQQPRFGKSNLIAADGKLFFSTMAGELVVVRASPTAYEEIGRKPILGTTRQAPAISDGLLYLRDDKEIVCLDVRK
jgi:outer membrane protein assembly factor BamB